jgi:hypothetical protein
LGSVAETATFSRIQKPVPLLLTSLGFRRGVTADLRDRSVSTHERRVELTPVDYRLLCHLAGEPTRVLTKVDSELKAEEGKGFRGSRRDW